MNTKIESAATLQKVIQLTRDVFGREVKVGPGIDYEFPEHAYTLLEIQIKAPPQQIVALENLWAEKVNEIAPGDLSFSLSIIALP